MNYADKVEPINRKYPFTPSDAQRKNLNEKVEVVSRLFAIPSRNILYYSAVEEYNVSKLVNLIADVIKRQF